MGALVLISLVMCVLLLAAAAAAALCFFSRWDALNWVSVVLRRIAIYGMMALKGTRLRGWRRGLEKRGGDSKQARHSRPCAACVFCFLCSPGVGV